MRKPRDFDSELKALADKAKALKERRIRQFGELVMATGADALDADLLAGALIDAATRAISRSVYGQDLIDLNENWRILIGGRYDLLAQRERVFDPFGALTGEPTSSLSKGTKGYFSPRAGILYRPEEETQFFAAYGKSLIPNTGVRIQSGEAPPPQQDTQYELGFRREFLDRKMSFEVGLFDITRDNVAIPNPANPRGFYSVVTGQQHSHGIEVNLGGEILPNLKINAVATFLHALVSKDDNIPSQQGSDLLGAPRRVYSFNANYAFDSGGFKGLGLGVSYHCASRLEVTLPGFSLAPQQMLGATLGYNFNDDLKFELTAANLTNQSNWNVERRALSRRAENDRRKPHLQILEGARTAYENRRSQGT
jgi:iron complex outermembrane receptor protein